MSRRSQYIVWVVTLCGWSQYIIWVVTVHYLGGHSTLGQRGERTLFSQWATTSLSHLLWESTGSADKVANLTPAESTQRC